MHVDTLDKKTYMWDRLFMSSSFVAVLISCGLMALGWWWESCVAASKATLLTHVEQKVSRVREYLRVVPFYGDSHSFNVNLLFPSTLRRVFGSDRWIDKYY